MKGFLNSFRTIIYYRCCTSYFSDWPEWAFWVSELIVASVLVAFWFRKDG